MHDETDDEAWISKSQRKRDAHALQDLGEKLIKLDNATLAKIPLGDDLREAVSVARKIKQHGALKRQLQYIGKLMRGIDAEPIRAAYEAVTNNYRKDIQHLHQLEDWRDRLLAEGDGALSELIAEYPTADRQHIRQLIRSAKKDADNQRPPRAARELFQYLKELLTSEA